MFCEKCGKKNDDNARFCESCGSIFETETILKEKPFSNGDQEKYDKEEYSDNKVYSQRKPMKTKSKIILIISVAVVALLAIFYMLGAKLADPEKVVEKYFRAISGGDYKAAYDYLEIPKGDFTSFNMFEQTAKEKYADFKENPVINYKVSEVLSNNVLTKTYKVEYTQKGNSSPQTFQVSLLRQSTKKWLFYDNYNVSDEEIIVNEYRVSVPLGAKAFVDGIEIPSSYKDKSNKEMESYIIKNMFLGNHKFKTTAPYMEEYEKEQIVEEGGECRITDVKISKASKDEINQTIQNAITQVYNSAIAGKGFESVSKFFTKNNESAEEGFANLSKNVCDEDYKLTEINFSNFKVNGNLEISEQILFDAEAGFNYNYTYVSKNYFSDESDTYSDEDSTDLNLTLMYENGKWLINNFNFYIYY